MPQLNLQSIVHSVQMSLVFVTTIFFSNVIDDVTTWLDRLGSENFPIPGPECCKFWFIMVITNKKKNSLAQPFA